MFIGDKVDDDYRGAEEVGITPILIRRESGEAGRDSGLKIPTSLAEVLQYVEPR